MERDRYLVTTDWLASHLTDPNLRILDCTVLFRPRADGREGFEAIPGRERWAAGHIPGAVYADLFELSDREQALPFMMPSAAEFGRVMGGYGVGDDSRVVLYDSRSSMWAARLWWMLRAFGFDKACVLDGGWTAWVAEDRPVSSEAPTIPPGSFTARPRAGLIASKEEVLAAVESGEACIVNALDAAQFRGEVAPYKRPGHIAGSANVPAMGSAGIVDPTTQRYLPIGEIRRRLEDSGARPADRMLTYCGGGIAASSVAFAATMAGYPDVAVYDGSLSEWAADPSLPMEAATDR